MYTILVMAAVDFYIHFYLLVVAALLYIRIQVKITAIFATPASRTNMKMLLINFAPVRIH